MSQPAETPKSALARNRRMATAVLVVMVVIYLATHLVSDPAGPVLLIRRMAEAGMIGGLADWFAVVALFRHPLGLPIPHTALLPKNQARAARNVGRFFETHFLEPAQLEARIRAIEPSRHLVTWIGQPGNAEALARELTGLVAMLLRQEPSPRMLAGGRRLLKSEVAQAGSDQAIAGVVADLVKTGVRGDVTDEIIAIIRRAIDENRGMAVELVQDNSRWWIATPVDRRVADLVVSAVLSMLDDLRRDSALRKEFETALDGMIETLEQEGVLTRAVADARGEFLRSGAFGAAIAGIARELRDRLGKRIANAPEALSGPLAHLIRDTATRALATPEARETLDRRLAELAGRVIGESRPQIAAYVTDVIAGWEPEELNTRFEEEIGPDLQFIRINGALLGALIGGGLFAFETLIG